VNIFHIVAWANPYEFYHNYLKYYYEVYKQEKYLLPTLDSSAADYFMVVNHPDPQNMSFGMDNKKIIHSYYEPPCTYKKWNKWGEGNWYNSFLYHHNTEENGTIVLPYLDGKSFKWTGNVEIPEEKLDRLAFVTTLYNIHPGHLARLEFLNYAEQVKYDYDLFGAKKHSMVGYSITKYPQFRHDIISKQERLNHYKYTLVIENTWDIGWFTEKLWDAILCECLPFYWGCPNLEKFIPAESFIRLPIENIPQSLEIIKSSITNKEWEKRIGAIKEAKNLLLNKYDLINTLKRVLG